jgi:hypothetical protein
MNLADLPEELAKAAPEALAGLLGPLLTACAMAIAAALTASRPPAEEVADDLLDVQAARQLLGHVSSDFLYRSPQLKEARVRIGGRVLFSRRRIQTLIARRAGR